MPSPGSMANVVYPVHACAASPGPVDTLIGYNGGYANPKAFEYYPGKGLELLRRHGFKIPPQKSIGQKRKAEDGRPDCAKKIRSGEATATQKPRNDDSEVAATTSTKKRSRAASPEDDQDIPILKKVCPDPTTDVVTAKSEMGLKRLPRQRSPSVPRRRLTRGRALAIKATTAIVGAAGWLWGPVFLIASPPVGLIEKMGGLFRVPPTSGWLTDARIMRYGEWSNSYTETLFSLRRN
ncbi:hypothetical protein FN846DRAFT_1013089 [Sphaerosporella brunnea]|uniref:Uncharacterized protein n=1 Tax=Sphaerosporella brunnea TaxID=1250544 RepID=A0A5J5EY34_9PEZI|nr:hypothetical protein FN846DRAFT_1013089 [Sphaerosporella brunnea]